MSPQAALALAFNIRAIGIERWGDPLKLLSDHVFA